MAEKLDGRLKGGHDGVELIKIDAIYNEISLA